MAVPGGQDTPTDVELTGRLLADSDVPFRVQSGLIGTVSVCAGTDRLALERARSGAIAEAMEGTAVALAAQQFGVPFAEVRGISNACGPRDGAPFELELAVRHATLVLARLDTP
jgi:futalosine hydrolase